MSSKRDLVEAHAFNRRRLVTAFISGAPGGREVEPVRPGRTLVGGLVLAVLLVAGAGVAGFLRPTLPDDWNEYGLVVGKETGSRYLAYEGELYPVINTTSARLLLDDFELTFAPEEQIAEQTPGVTIGIPGAPDALPGADALVQDGWTSCVDGSGRVKTRLAERPGARKAGSQGVVVESGGTTYVVTGESRHAVPDDDATLRALGLDSQTIRSVPGTWLDLFPLGSPLVPFEMKGSGRPVPARLDAPAGAGRVGSTLLVEGRPFVVARDGLVGLNDFEYAMYTSGGPGAEQQPVEVTAGEIAAMATSQEDPTPDDWPTETVTSYVPATDDLGGSVCALLRTDAEGAAKVLLATPSPESAAVPTSDDGSRTVEVESGHGALVQANAGSVVNRGTLYLVDASGTRYPIGGEDTTVTLTRLGYADVSAADVPLTWADLFPDGPELSPERALEPAVSQ